MNIKVLYLIFLCIHHISAFSFPDCDKVDCGEVNPKCCSSGEITGWLSGCGCQECAKAAQEPCGGPWDTTGRCASGLNCLMKWECRTKQGKNCIFPFNFRGKKYNACTSDYSKKKIHHGKWSWMAKWCATAVHRNGTVVKNNWGYCEMDKNDHDKIGCRGPNINTDGICVNKQEVEPQLKANKTVYYRFDKNYIGNTTTKIKRCVDSKSVGQWQRIFRGGA